MTTMRTSTSAERCRGLELSGDPTAPSYHAFQDIQKSGVVHLIDMALVPEARPANSGTILRMTEPARGRQVQPVSLKIAEQRDRLPPDQAP